MSLFKHEVETINGVTILFEALEEHISLSELLPDDTPEQLKDIEDDNVIFCAKVSAVVDGVEFASDYLGGCIYSEYEDFYTKYKSDYYADMVQTVLKEGRIKAIELRDKLNVLIG